MATTKAVLVVGGSGFIGTHLCLRLREQNKVFATYHSRAVHVPGVTHLPMDLGSQEWIKRVIYTVRPDLIIYAAGSCNTDWAEANPRVAEQLHTGGPAHVANASEILGSKFIYLSSSDVFDGNRGNYHEGDTILPNTALGRAKVGGENYIRGKCLNFNIVRASKLFGRGNGRNLSFLDRLRMRLERKEKVELPDSDLHSFAPVSGLIDLVERLSENGPRNKIFHYGGLTKMTHFQFAKAFAKRFDYDPSLIGAARTEGGRIKKSGIETNPDFSLNSSHTAEALKIKPLLLEEGFDLIENQLIPSS